jgi:hypothetical protein
VIGSVAGDTLVYAGLAKVKIVIITFGAVVMSIRDCALAAVAAHPEVTQSGSKDGGRGF